MQEKDKKIELERSVNFNETIKKLKEFYVNFPDFYVNLNTESKTQQHPEFQNWCNITEKLRIEVDIMASEIISTWNKFTSLYYKDYFPSFSDTDNGLEALFYLLRTDNKSRGSLTMLSGEVISDENLFKFIKEVNKNFIDYIGEDLRWFVGSLCICMTLRDYIFPTSSFKMDVKDILPQINEMGNLMLNAVRGDLPPFIGGIKYGIPHSST